MSQEMNLPEAGAAADVAVTPPKTSGFKGLGEVIYSPVAYFKKVKESPTILVPYIALGIVSLVVLLLLTNLIADMQMQNQQVQEQMANSKLTPEQMKGYMKPFIIGLGLPVLLLGPLVIAGLAMFWGNFVFGGRARFSQILSVACWGEYLFALGGLLVAPLMLAKGSMLVSFSLAPLVANLGPENFWFVLLSKISVFHIWELIVIGLGLSIVYEFPRNKGMWLSVLSMGLLSIIQIAWVGIKSLL